MVLGLAVNLKHLNCKYINVVEFNHFFNVSLTAMNELSFKTLFWVTLKYVNLIV